MSNRSFDNTYAIYWEGMDNSPHEEEVTCSKKSLIQRVTDLEEHGAKNITVTDEFGFEVEL